MGMLVNNNSLSLLLCPLVYLGGGGRTRGILPGTGLATGKKVVTGAAPTGSRTERF